MIKFYPLKMLCSYNAIAYLNFHKLTKAQMKTQM